jgi:hypothetical protein
MYRQLALTLAALAPLGLAACPTRDISSVDQTPTIEARQVISVATTRAADILFVIDNSHSMKEEQESLARNFGNFINVLNGIQGGLPSIHIGVVTTDLGIGGHTSDQCDGEGDRGLLQQTPRVEGCQPPNDPYIRDTALPGGERDRNYTGSLAEAFSCIAQVGIGGCGVEQHLEAMKLALSRPENQGFLRQDAYLAVVILADEDDCSANRAEIVFNPDPEQAHINSPLGPFNSFRCTEFGVLCDNATLPRAAGDYRTCVPRTDSYMNDPISYWNFLKGLKSSPSLLIGAVIAGNPTPFGVGLTERGAPNLKPSCQSANGVADPGIRLKAFSDQFGDHGAFISICQDDLSVAIQTVADLLARIIGTECLQGRIDARDVDASNPGTQLACHVADVRFSGTANETEKAIPRCRMVSAETPDTTGTSSDRPCWWVTPNTDKCSTSPTQLELKIERGGDDAPIGTSVISRCRVSE